MKRDQIIQSEIYVGTPATIENHLLLIEKLEKYHIW